MQGIRPRRLTAAAVACLLSIAALAAPAAVAAPPGLASVSDRVEARLASVYAALRLAWADLWTALARPEPKQADSSGCTGAGAPPSGAPRPGAGTACDPDG